MHTKNDNFFMLLSRNAPRTIRQQKPNSLLHTRSYLLLINPQVLAKAKMNPEDVVTSMCLSCGIPTLLSGLFGNLPFVMAPGLGLSAYLTYGLCKEAKEGAGGMTWQVTSTSKSRQYFVLLYW
jgi:xanthine/uracil/vitamin C permease (AzgA family)